MSNVEILGGANSEPMGSALVTLGNLASSSPLTIVETRSGITVAAVRHDKLNIYTGNITTSESLGLTVVSVNQGGTLFLETHSAEWNNHIGPQRAEIDPCTLATCHGVILPLKDGKVTPIFGGLVNTMVEPVDLSMYFDRPHIMLGSGIKIVRNPRPDEDVFHPANSQAMNFARHVLSLHGLVSPAANEAFGMPYEPLEELPSGITLVRPQIQQ
jgi:hypothetical protein